MIQRKGHHMEGGVTTWREVCNGSKEGSPHGGKGHHTTWREGCNDSKEGSPHRGKGVMIPRKGTLHEGKG